MLVKVPLRRRLVEGIVISLQAEKPEGNFDIKEIAAVISDAPLLTQHQIETAKWMADYYFCTVRHTLSPWLPGQPWAKLLPEQEEWIRLKVTPEKIRGKKQQVLIGYLYGKDWMKKEEVKAGLSVSNAVLKRLIDAEALEVKSETSFSEVSQDVLLSDVSLTPRQTAAYKAMKADKRPTLLFGITGSGKTEIYAALIRDAINEGKSAILLLPEILLTENFIERFQQLVDRNAIAVVHSKLTLAKRREAWRRCHAGEIRLVIGSRSALFSPLPDLGLVILDEEHEWTYKNEQTPRYHAGKVAEHLSTTSKVVFGSATPSVESWYKAKNGQYQLVELPERYGGAALPTVQIVDLASTNFGDYYPLSPTLINAIRTRLDRHEQSILFLNRRGFATSLMCLDCRYRFEDAETKLPFTVHYTGARPYLLSHHTGEQMDLPMQCPKCDSVKLQEVGAGTQKVEKLLDHLFPTARILRADADTLKSPEQMRILLQKMKENRADILMGTQSVVKGLDLPNVTLAAVLLADVGLSLPHFRAGERVFQLLTQLTGRSGRAKAGEVIIQTFRPNAAEVSLAAQHNVRSYLEAEIVERQKVHYPPDTEMIRIVFSTHDAKRESRKLAELLRKRGEVRVSCTPSIFSGGRVWYVFLRGKNVQEILRRLPVHQGVVDRDPIECV
jgi:primosomal protein N' (replication factor Y)